MLRERQFGWKAKEKTEKINYEIEEGDTEEDRE